MAMLCSIYGHEHRRFKRKTLILSLLDLIFITAAVAFVITQLISVSNLYTSLKDSHNNETETIKVSNVTVNNIPVDDVKGEITLSVNTQNKHENDTISSENDEDTDFSDNSLTLGDNFSVEKECNSTSQDYDGCDENGSNDDDFMTYRTVIGARISLSIQLIIYVAQWFFGILLFIAAYHNDSRNLHLWVLFSEIMVVIVCLNLFINFFGRFIWTQVIVTALYIIFKIFLIRLVRKFIHVNDLALTQFGPVNDFD